MSQKTAFVFCLWTAVWCAVFYFFYELVLGHINVPEARFQVFQAGFDVPWVMFACMTIFFAIQLKPKQMGAAMICYFCGLGWGQLDYFLIRVFNSAGMSVALATFISLIIGTMASMYLHMQLLGNTPFQYISFVFIGVCSTFAAGGLNIPGLVVTSVWGIVLAALCMACLIFCNKRWPNTEKGKEEIPAEAGE